MDKGIRIAVVGATGVVGRELLAALASQGHPGDQVVALASERSVGQEVDYGDEALEVEKATPEAFRGVRVALLAVPADVARTLAPAAQGQGAWVVDLSAAFLADTSVPVVVPAVNGAALAPKGRIVRCASAVTTALALVLEPLRKSFGVAQVVVTAALGASSAGTRGIAELETQCASLLSGRELEPGLFPHRLAFNLIPQVGPFAQGGSTGEELAWRADLLRLWGAEAPAAVDGTALQVPTFFGHAVSLTVKLGRSADAGQVREVLKQRSELKVLDSPQEKVYPMPLLVTGDPAVLVGRVRPFAGLPDTFSLFAVVDNAGRGGALNALDTAELLLARG